jgi:bifunctional non-homologous end joining protein LigD
MSLIKYKKKRTLSETAEPVGGKPGKNVLHFVVQKHAASHLHYDFRLEMGGVLKSWAVPKGPSLDPEIKRLAMMVEDHPYDYRTFEGVIPEGNYGAGTVMVWDAGTYEAADVTGSKNTHEQNLLKQLKNGKIKFSLNGIKLQGEFVLLRTSQGGKENTWLLKKIKDEFASQNDITTMDKSVKSKKTISELADTTVSGTKKNPEKRKVLKPGSNGVKKKLAPFQIMFLKIWQAANSHKQLLPC